MTSETAAPGRDAAAQDPNEKRILRDRARALALVAEREEAASETLLLVEFLLNGEHYAVETQHVREVAPLRDLTPLPGTPPFVMGMINIRRQILTVIDIKVFFNLPRPPLSDLNRVIIVQSGDLELGLLADTIAGVRSLSRRDVQPVPPTLTGISAQYLRGITPEPLIILDIPAILSDDRILIEDDSEP